MKAQDLTQKNSAGQALTRERGPSSYVQESGIQGWCLKVTSGRVSLILGGPAPLLSHKVSTKKSVILKTKAEHTIPVLEA